NVYVTQGGTQPLRVEADDNILEKVRTSVQENTLVIETDGGCFRNVKLNIYASMANIKRLEIAGSGDIESKSPVKSDDLDVVISGSGDVKLNVTAKTINTELKGSGDITLYGKADTHNVRKAGSGDINAANLLAQNTFVTSSGSGDVEVNAVQQLDVKNSGSGDVAYTSNPPQLTVSNTGSGKVSKK
ncbi:MAG: head GIN domain-containing protein, partial [Pyrinomonadaceae bacterium]